MAAKKEKEKKTGGGLKFLSDHIYAFNSHCKSSVGKRLKSSDIQSNLVYYYS